MYNSYQDVDVFSKGQYGAALKANQTSRRTSVKMMAGGGDSKSPFFDLKCGMLDGSGEKSMGDLTKGKKAILIVNVASE